MGSEAGLEIGEGEVGGEGLGFDFSDAEVRAEGADVGGVEGEAEGLAGGDSEIGVGFEFGERAVCFEPGEQFGALGDVQHLAALFGGDWADEGDFIDRRDRVDGGWRIVGGGGAIFTVWDNEAGLDDEGLEAVLLGDFVEVVELRRILEEFERGGVFAGEGDLVVVPRDGDVFGDGAGDDDALGVDAGGDAWEGGIEADGWVHGVCGVG